MAKQKVKQKPQTSGKLSSTLPSSEPPPPYTTPRPVLAPFLETLDPKHIYITHIDVHPASFKRQIFVVPILMNIAIFLGLVYRIYCAVPFYSALIMSVLGHPNAEKYNPKELGLLNIADIAMGRAGIFFFDFALYQFIFPWPRDFFYGPKSPTTWRWRVGFREREIVVRRSRRWDENMPKEWLREESDANKEVYRERIMPAINKGWVKRKTGYLMMDKNWDLDFAGMVTAHELVAKGQAQLDDFRKMVVAYSEQHGWLTW
jgi:hypothetical protein